MYSYETFYDHYVVLKDGKILYHVDTEAEAKKEIELLSGEKIKEDDKRENTSENYIVYHLHTEQSLLDSCTNYKLYVDKAKELGQTAICFTEHGNLYCWYEKKMYCDKQGIKYMHGVECYLTSDKLGEDKHRDNYHTVLIAKNRAGFEELNRLVFNSTKQDHFYYKPRITFDEFFNISDNIIKISACLASPLCRYRENDEILNKLLSTYDFYEIQYHNYLEQIEYNKWLYEMAKKYNKPLIAGTDTHSINKYKAECRTILQWGKEIIFQDEDKFDLTYKSYDELVDMFKEQNSLSSEIYLEAIENTNKMAAMVEPLEIDTKVKYPFLYGERDEEVMWNTLRRKYMEKLKQGIITKDQQYIDNIKEEMRVFKKTNMVGFMLFMSEMMSWCRENNIPTSPCRGSVGGSTVAFISDIIDVDPIKWKTVFSRFCNEDRVEVGDIDCDFYEDDRPKVYDYIINRFGKENTAYILASGTVVDKGAIDLIGKGLHLMYKSKGDPYRYTLAEVAEIKEKYEKSPEDTKENYDELFYYFDGILNTVVSQSQHPAGIVASPINLVDNCSVFIGGDGQYILPINMEEVHEIGLVKYDILGLKNIGIINKCCEYAGLSYPRAHEINWNDQAVFQDMITSPIGVFQFESPYAFELLKKFGVHTINDMSLVNASLRPSGESYRDRLIAHEPNHNPSELIDELLAPNHGYLCLDESQLICTKDGLKPISKIQIGDVIYTTNGEDVVNNIYNNGVKPTYKISTYYGDIICTDNHPILTNKGFVEAKEVIANPKEYSVAHIVGTNSQKSLDKNILKLLGWFLGDGILHQSPKEKNKVQFVNANINVINGFVECVNNLYGKELQCSICNRKTRVNKTDLFYVSVNWIKQKKLTDKPIISMLKKYKMFDKLAIEKEVPKEIFSLSKESLLYFLGAYTDTDCCIGSPKKPILSYRTASYDLAMGIQEVIRLIGYNSCITADINGYTISIKDAKSLLKKLLNYSVNVRDKYAKNVDSLNTIREVKLGELPYSYVEDIINRNNITKKMVESKCGISLYNVNYVKVETLQKIISTFGIKDVNINSSVRYFKITNIEPYKDNSVVYDLEIKNTHNFALKGGAIVHNCFQEDVIAFLQQICGLSGSDADNVRRAIGRKQMDRLQAALPQILEGYCSKSTKPRAEAEEEAKIFLKIIEDASSYMFGYNHSTGYSMLGYLCAYMRYYYPTEFICAFLNCSKSNEDIYNGTMLARQKNISIEPIQFRKSLNEFTCDPNTNTIYKGLASIKNIGSNNGTELYALKDNSYNDFIELLNDIKQLTTVNSKQLDILIKLNFFAEFGDIHKLLYIRDVWDKFYGAKVLTKAKLDPYELECAIKVAKRQTEKQLRDFDSKELIELLTNVEVPCCLPQDKLGYELELLGYTDIVDEDCDEDIYGVESVETNKYNQVWVKLYQVCNGKSAQYKVNKYWYTDNPIKQGDIIKARFQDKEKSRKVGDKFVKTGEYETQLKMYAKQ